MRSALKRCRRGHCYDEKRHTRCPYCGVTLPSMLATRRLSQVVEEAITAQRRASDSERTKTQRRRDPEAQSYGDVTLAYWGRSGFDPLVGWLVCIEGPEQGKDYRIRRGNNRIGRDDAMDIVVRGDEAISRDRQALIAYDHRSRRFLIREGEARGLISVNGQPIAETAMLAAWDVLEIGQSRFCFVPLCGERFRWEAEE